MANTPQAKKRIRRNERRAEINGARVSRIRTFVKKAEAALESGDKDAAKAAVLAMQPELARGVAKGVIHKNTASRKFSRLTKRLSALASTQCRRGFLSYANSFGNGCETNREASTSRAGQRISKRAQTTEKQRKTTAFTRFRGRFESSLLYFILLTSQA
jgi:small subunit ribosomal protein S20